MQMQYCVKVMADGRGLNTLTDLLSCAAASVCGSRLRSNLTINHYNCIHTGKQRLKVNKVPANRVPAFALAAWMFCK